MHELNQLVVVRKHGLVNSSSGVVSIVYSINAETDEFETPSLSEFPTGAIWISRGYDEICQKFAEGELFQLQQYHLTDKENEIYKNAKSDNKHDHWAMGNAAKKLDSGKLIPVIKTPLPDIASGKMNYIGEIPNSSYFFILDDDFVYGPFSATRSEDEIVATPAASGVALNLSTNHIAKIKRDDLLSHDLYKPVDKSRLQLTAEGFIPSVKEILAEIPEKITQLDFINDKQLITFFTKNGFGSNGSRIGKKPAEQLKVAIAEARKLKLLREDNLRVDRLSKLLDQYLEYSDIGKDIIDNWLATQSGREFLEKFVKENPQYIDIHTEELTLQKTVLTSEIETIKVEKRRIEQEVLAEKARVQEERNKAEKEIEKIKKQTREEQERERSKVLSDLEAHIQDKKSEYKILDDRISALLEQLETVESVQELQSRVDYLGKREKELSRIVEEQENQLTSPNFPSEALKVHNIIELIQGRRSNAKVTLSTYRPAPTISTVPDKAQSIIAAITDHFEEHGRNFNYEEVANIQIVLQQSFMTVFKGRPGAGKTSTAIRLAHAHHLADESGQSCNFLNIPAARGWVSSRDFLGFYNSLKGEYQPAKTGLYQFLRQGKDNGAGNTLRLILLDEGNLSPIEHYMSDFLGMFDIEGRNRPLDTGIPKEDLRHLQVPSNIRFVVTINNDHTTEPLSPRLCDRVPIINMDSHSQSEGPLHSAADLNGAIPYAKLEEYFGIPTKSSSELTSYDDLPPKISNLLPRFQDPDKSLGNAIIVSKRKQIAMHYYAIVASRYMSETFAADFAVSQYLLPLINGFGKPFRGRLEKILEYTSRNGLGMSTEIVESILRNGDGHVGHYSYF